MPKTVAKKQMAPRSITFNIRVPIQQSELIDSAARRLGKTRTDFILETACREAESVLLDQRFFFLDEEAYNQFKSLLDAPPDNNDKLRDLLNTKAPWE